MKSKNSKAVAVKCHGSALADIDALTGFQNNLKTMPEKNLKKFKNQLLELGFSEPISVWVNKGKQYILNGHMRLAALKSLREDGYAIPRIPINKVEARNRQEAKKKVLALTSQYGEFDKDGFQQFLLDAEIDPAELADFEFAGFEFEPDDQYGHDPEKTGNMSKAWGYPPFSVLNAREGSWQDRKQAWLDRGIESLEGRDTNLLQYSQFTRIKDSSTSIFDPVLCEILYRWFCPERGRVFDPFAGGSVRGLVAYYMGLQYVGVDIRKEQVKANEKQYDSILKKEKREKKGKKPEKGSAEWLLGDSQEIDRICKRAEYDFLLSCPPYADLEKYSDMPGDISNMKYPQFKSAYANIINKSCALLKKNSFACFVVGEIRKKDGSYQGFISDTIAAFEAAGLKYYNEMILVTAIGSLPLRAGVHMRSSRKVGKSHQNVLVFLKGDAKEASKRCGEIIITEGQKDEEK